MKRSFSIAFLLIYSVLLVKPAVPIVNYYVQLEAYKMRCRNVEKPVLQCEGTCHLQSEIKTESKAAEPVLPLSKSAMEENPVVMILGGFFISNYSLIIEPNFVAMPVSVCNGCSNLVFHPPLPYV